MTPRLYFDDPLLVEFDARVHGHATYGGWPSVVLDRTGFYPEAGGQMADRGFIEVGGERIEIVDVQCDEAGSVHHRLANDALPSVGTALRATVDKARRRVHMALHTGQHMLSRALLDVANAPTVSARLGETACTIDIDRASVPEVELARAEDLVNDVIDDDRAVRAYFPTSDELAALALRRAPKVSVDVRVVDIDGFDVSPCGGTHCTRTGQVGLVKVTGVERYKGKTRLGFTAGKRARGELGGARDVLAAVAERLTTSADNALGALDKLRADFAAEREKTRALARELAGRLADELVETATRRGSAVVVATIPGGTTDMLRAIATKVTARDGAVALLAGDDGEGRPVVFTRNGAATFDCGATLKKIAAQSGGRGGGRPEHAEGRLPATAELERLLHDHLGGSLSTAAAGLATTSQLGDTLLQPRSEPVAEGDAGKRGS